ATVPGVNVPYEEPTKPEVVVDSETMSVKACAERVVGFILKNRDLKKKTL
ncbi:adenylyl-sulfate kinase, partial [ANME-1 cluster archaeon GoMg4]|nr:adenylyl-sulfate kinase [ANME-1 cluster archaeon GoMg4]